jgi:glutamate-1-semialdehyde 2,1-aminomutase
MAAGLAQLRTLEAEAPYPRLERLAGRLAEGVAEAARERGIPATGRAVGSMWGVHFVDPPVRSFADAQETDRRRYARFHRACMERGVYLAPSPFEAAFVSTAHTEEDVARTIRIAGEALEEALAGEHEEGADG